MRDVLQFTTELALEAGNLLLQFFDPGGIQATQKPDRTVVTEADLAADRLITAAIQKNFPEDEIISEESSHEQGSNKSSIWIIDPLDGTTNFSLGLSIWGVSIARIKDGYPQIGVVYFPLLKELYTSKKGAGAYLNHFPISVRPPDPRQPMSFFACCSRTFRYYDISVPYKPRILGSGAYTFCMVARGTAIMGFDAAPKIWDLAAVWLLVEEAGGIIMPFEGKLPFAIDQNCDHQVASYPTLAAANADIIAVGRNKIHRKSKFAIVVPDKA
jgi:myo-inositol-1(or 4)-monophosphatase